MKHTGSWKQLVPAIVTALILTGTGCVVHGQTTSDAISVVHHTDMSSMPPTPPADGVMAHQGGEEKQVSADSFKASKIVDHKSFVMTKPVSNINRDENVILARNGGTINASDVMLTKTGDTSSEDASNF